MQKKNSDCVLWLKKHGKKPYNAADCQVFHISERLTSTKSGKNPSVKNHCALGVLVFYTTMCRRYSDFKLMSEFIRSCPTRYLNPHYLRAIIVNPGNIATRYVCQNGAYTSTFNADKIRAGAMLKMRLLMSSALMSDIVRLLLKANKGSWNDPETRYPGSPTHQVYMDMIQSEEARSKAANLNKAALSSSHFEPHTALDAMLFQYPLAFCTLTVKGEQRQSYEGACNQAFPLAHLWCKSVMKGKYSVGFKQLIPKIWHPSFIHDAMSKGEYNWRFIQWPVVPTDKAIEKPPYGLLPNKNPTTPGKLHCTTCMHMSL